MIEKTNFRDQVRVLLLEKMRSGDLEPENSLSLAYLAKDLDVSVTPIREALSQLQSSGIVKSIPNRGFFIPKLSKEEAINLYELVAALETLAVRSSVFKKDDIKVLTELNKFYESTLDKIQRVNADMKFHEALTSNYKNSLALKILSELKTRIFLYEVDYMSNEDYYTNSSNDHKHIIKNIKDQNIDKACELLRENWQNIGHLT